MYEYSLPKTINICPYTLGYTYHHFLPCASPEKVKETKFTYWDFKFP